MNLGFILLAGVLGGWFWVARRGGSAVVDAYSVDIGGQSVEGYDLGSGVGVLPVSHSAVVSPYQVNTRGFRNNNPGNIEYSPANEWVGQVGTDGRYVVFSELRYGVRALSRLLQTYYYRYELRTIEGILSRWAPDFENDLPGYVRAVSLRTGFAPGELLTFPGDLPRLVEAVIHHENGVQPIPINLVVEWSAL